MRITMYTITKQRIIVRKRKKMKVFENNNAYNIPSSYGNVNNRSGYFEIMV